MDRIGQRWSSTVKAILITPQVYILTILLVLLNYFWIPGFGLKAEYYDTADWSLPPLQRTLVQRLSFNSQTFYGDFVKGGDFSVRYQGYLLVLHSGRYRFRVSAVDQSFLALDGQVIIKTFADNRLQEVGQGLDLERGFHKLEIGYTDNGGDYGFSLQWCVDRDTFTSIPFWLLFPEVSPIWSCILRLFFSLSLLLGCFCLSIYHLIRIWSLSSETTAPKLVIGVIVSVTVLLGACALHDLNRRRQKAAHGCDTYGYLQAAQLMAQEGFVSTKLSDVTIPLLYNGYRNRPSDRELIFLQGPHAYYVHDFEKGLLVNQYPPGFPLMVSMVYRFFGETPVYSINVTLYFVFFIILFIFFKRHYDLLSAAITSIFLLFQPLLFNHSIVLMSDLPSALLLFIGCIMVLPGSYQRPRAFLAGVILGYALLVRYSNSLFLIPVLIVLIWSGRKHFINLGGLVVMFFLGGVIPLGYYHKSVFGSFLAVTYPYTNVGKLSLHNIPLGLHYYLLSLYQEFGGVISILILSGLLIALFRPKLRGLHYAFIAFSGAHLLFISANAILLARYLVPLVPIMLYFGGVTVYTISRRIKAYKFGSWIMLFLFLVLLGPPLQNRVRFSWAADRKPEEIAYLIGQTTEKEARIFCDDLSGALRIYGSRYGYRLKFAPLEMLTQSIQLLLDNGYPVYILIDTRDLWITKKRLELYFKYELIDSPLPLYKLSSRKDIGAHQIGHETSRAPHVQ